ncbi:MAG: acylphosphatase [Gammaproteobacteria bacterium]|nr:MAG: acylphosphatase [Gammaproteobacteria bacterium]
MKVCTQVHVSGTVQGVFFRASAQQQAIEFGISGYARNLADGDVELIICGEQKNIDVMLKWLEHGPENAEVENIQSKQVPLQEFNHFSIG